MDIAADAGFDAIAPQAPPRPAASANAPTRDGDSFQDHLDPASAQANDRSNESHRHSRQSAPTRSTTTVSATKSETADAAASTDKGKALDELSAQPDAVAASPQHPPILVQLIAATPQPIAQQQDANVQAPNVAEQAATTAATASVAPTLVPATKTTQTLPTPSRTQAKAQHAKTTTETADAPKQGVSAATDAPATNAEAAAAITDQLTAVVPTAVAAESAPIHPQTQTSHTDNASIIGVQAAPPRETQRRAFAPVQATTPWSMQSPAAARIEEPEQSAAQAEKPSLKTAAPIEQLKQTAQDLAASAKPSAPAQAPTSPSTAPIPHAPPATSAQAASADATSVRAAPLAAAQVGGEIIRRFNGHDTTFQLRLDPPELGRVDVRLEVSRDHRVTALISADTPQALSDLSRGARDLQQALQSAGLDLADDGLSFDLSSNGQSNSFAQANQTAQHASSTTSTVDAPIVPETIAARPLRVDSWRGSRIDLMA